MSSANRKKSKGKPDLKELRKSRREHISRVTQKVKNQKEVVLLVKKALKEGPRTIPEIAETTGLQSPLIMWYVASLRKYGQISEGEKQGDYFQYGLVQSGTQEAGS